MELDSKKKEDGVYNTRFYIWGKIPKGLSMQRHSLIYRTPTMFKEISNYNFSKVSLQHDFAIAIGHAVKLVFTIPAKQSDDYNFGSQSKEKLKPSVMEVMAIPIYDGVAI